VIGGWIPASWPAPGNITAGTTLRGTDIETLDLPGTPCWLRQVHGVDVVTVGAYAEPPVADAAIGRRPGDVCVVKTADCLPVLLCAADGSRVAAAHAGWRGLAAGVLEATVSALEIAPGELLAWLGPAISQAAFEVGDEVREAFLTPGPDAAPFFAPNARGRWQADLYGLARLRLAQAGVTRVSGGGLCTVGDRDRFYSYRRDGETGRLVSFVAIGRQADRGRPPGSSRQGLPNP